MFELAQLPPPGRKAEAGYYPDPLGSGRARWWDGTTWTSTIGPKVEPDAPPARPLPTPTKVCPRCAVQSQTFAPRCPNCGRTYSRASGWQLVAIIAGTIVLGLGGCGACIAVSVNSVEDELDRNAISEREFESVKRGTTRAAVEARLGDPWDTFSDDGIECITYTAEGGLFDLTLYDLCFLDGRLVSKDAY
ncbi:MAG: DUF2510 domain-containing protein [Solirubrobacterales bacterium]